MHLERRKSALEFLKCLLKFEVTGERTVGASRGSPPPPRNLRSLGEEMDEATNPAYHEIMTTHNYFRVASYEAASMYAFATTIINFEISQPGESEQGYESYLEYDIIPKIFIFNLNKFFLLAFYFYFLVFFTCSFFLFWPLPPPPFLGMKSYASCFVRFRSGWRHWCTDVCNARAASAAPLHVFTIERGARIVVC